MKVGSTIKNYKILNELRPGAGGSVYVVEDVNTHEKFVLKSSYLEESRKAQFEKVVSGWKNLSGKNVVEFKEFFYEETKSYVVMEYCSGGDLESIIKKMKAAKKKFTEAEIAKIATDVLKGLQAMQAMRMIHRDLKAANILKADDGTYKLADFNVSRVVSDDTPTTMTFAGTMQYVAPELLQNRPPSFASDIYALGAVFYELITLVPAFTGMDIPSVLANRYNPLDASLGYSAGLAQLVHRMLALDPTARPTVDEALFAPVFVRAQADEVEDEQRRQAASLTVLQHTMADQHNTIRTLQRTVGEQQTNMNEQQRKINNLERTVTEQDGRIRELQAAVENLRSSVAASKQTAAAMPIPSSKPSTPVQQSPPSPPKTHICTKNDMEKGNGTPFFYTFLSTFYFTQGGLEELKDILFGGGLKYHFGICKCVCRCVYVLLLKDIIIHFLDIVLVHSILFQGRYDGEHNYGKGDIKFCVHKCRSCNMNYCKKCVAKLP